MDVSTAKMIVNGPNYLPVFLCPPTLLPPKTKVLVRRYLGADVQVFQAR